MNVDKTSSKLRRMVGSLHRAYHYNGLPEDTFQKNLDRVNRVLKSVRPHYDKIRERKERVEALGKLQRYMAYRHADLGRGSAFVVILTKDDGGFDAIRNNEILDLNGIDKIGAQDIVLVTNMQFANKSGFAYTRGNTIDLYHVAHRLFGQAMSVEDLADRLGITVSQDRYKAVQQIGYKLISDFDEILKDAI